MNYKLSKSKLYSLLFTLILFVGFQDSLIAQVRVSNFTGCTITVYVGQNDATTAAICDLCPVNPPAGTAVTIINGGTVDIYGQDVCFEEAGWIAWQVGGGFGISPNPGLPGCVPNLTGPSCIIGATTTAIWTTSGPGYVSALIL